MDQKTKKEFIIYLSEKLNLDIKKVKRLINTFFLNFPYESPEVTKLGQYKIKDSEFEKLRSLLGKKVTYTFPTKKDRVYIHIIEDNFQRSVQFEGYIHEDYYVDAEKGVLVFDELKLHEDSDSYEDDIKDLMTDAKEWYESLSSSKLEDGKCLFGCGYHPYFNGFCSIHSHLNPNDYEDTHTQAIKNHNIKKLRELRKFLKEPLPKTLKYTVMDYEDDNGEYHEEEEIIFTLKKIV